MNDLNNGLRNLLEDISISGSKDFDKQVESLKIIAKNNNSKIDTVLDEILKLRETLNSNLKTN